MRLTTTKKKEPKIFEGLNTKIDENKYFLKINENSYEDTMQNVADKLGQIEDVEEELGIDLITLFKARKGFYAYDFHENYDGVIQFTEDLWANIFEGVLGGSKIVKREGNVVYVAHARCEFQDYGKTWALTKEELQLL